MNVPAEAALLALHYQNDVVDPGGRIRVGMAEGDPARAAVLQAAAALLAGARAQALPVFHVRIAFRPDYADLVANCAIFRRTREIGAVREGTWGAEFHAGLAPLAGSALETVITHRRISAFAGTPLAALLEGMGARRLVVAGVATHSVVEGTVRDAVDRGFHVSVAADACHAAEPAAHAASLESMRLLADIRDVRGALAWARGDLS